jgi:DNA-binding transcriptional ArsR family regulator
MPPTSASTGPSSDLPPDQVVVRADAAVDDLLTALEDAGCRAILDATGDEALSARELSERCDLPLSTTYRKLDRLTRVGLLAERTRIRPSGRHASEYTRRVTSVRVSLNTGRLELRRTPQLPADWRR